MRPKATKRSSHAKGSTSKAPSRELREIAAEAERELNVIQRAMRQEFRAEVERGNLTGPQRLVMSVVVRHDGINLQALSNAVSLAHSTVSGIVDRLVKQGLIEKTTDEADRRLTMLIASRPVRDFLETRMQELAVTPLMKALSRTERARAKEILSALRLLSSLLTPDATDLPPRTDEFEEM
jgi:DNA-binding MarR family transcriptional regulator